MKTMLSRILLSFSTACVSLSLVFVLITKASARSVMKEDIQEYLSEHPGKSKLHAFFGVAYQGAKHLPMFYPGTFLLGCFIGWAYSMFEAFMLTQAGLNVDGYMHTGYVLPTGVTFLTSVVLLPVLFPTPSTLISR